MGGRGRKMEITPSVRWTPGKEAGGPAEGAAISRAEQERRRRRQWRQAKKKDK